MSDWQKQFWNMNILKPGLMSCVFFILGVVSSGHEASLRGQDATGTQSRSGQQSETKKVDSESTPKTKNSVADSSKSESSDSEWIVFKIPDQPCKLQFPETPTRKEKKFKPAVDAPEISLVKYQSKLANGKVLFSFNHSKLKEDMRKLSARLKALKQAEQNTIAAVLAIKAKTSKEIRYGRYRGREFSYNFTFTNPKTAKTNVWNRRTALYIVGQNLYELSVTQKASEKDEAQKASEKHEALARKFIDSLEIENTPRTKKKNARTK